MKKNLFLLVTLVSTMFILTACGKDHVAVPGVVDYQGEGPVQGGIPTDDEIAAREEENNKYDNYETEEPVNVDNTGHEPESYGSGNFQDYWSDDTHFDLVSYLYANGAERVYATDGESYNPAKDGAKIKCYMATFYDGYWEITVYLDGAVSIEHPYTDGEGFIRRDPTFLVTCMPTSSVTIDSDNNISYIEVITTLDVIVQNMLVNHENYNPIENSNLIYAELHQ